ncbi:MAG: helix-turn-helix transcriptional regulator [Bacillota bacterium]
MNKFAERLQDILKDKNISQSEFARKVSTTHQTVNRWCNGNNEPNFDMLITICSELDEDPNYLLGWDD